MIDQSINNHYRLLQEFWEVSRAGKADPFDEHDEDLELEEAVSADGIHDHNGLSSDQNMLTSERSILSSSQHAPHTLQHTSIRMHQSVRKHDCRKQLRVQIIVSIFPLKKEILSSFSYILKYRAIHFNVIGQEWFRF